jgi:hypothetical protein
LKINPEVIHNEKKKEEIEGKVIAESYKSAIG